MAQHFFIIDYHYYAIPAVVSIDLRRDDGYRLKQQEMMSTESNSWYISIPQFKYTGISVKTGWGKKQPKPHQLPTPIPNIIEETRITLYDVEQASSFGRTLRHASAMSLASLA